MGNDAYSEPGFRSFWSLEGSPQLQKRKRGKPGIDTGHGRDVKGKVGQKIDREKEGHPISHCPLVLPASPRHSALHEAITEVKVEEEVKKETL